MRAAPGGLRAGESHRRRAAGGFSLLEVLVAFAILVISLGALLRVFGGGMRAAALAEEYSRAAILAESKLASMGVEEPLTEGSREGEFDDTYRWRSLVAEYPVETPTSQIVVSAVKLLEVTVEVNWSSGVKRRAITLSTLRLLPSL